MSKISSSSESTVTAVVGFGVVVHVTGGGVGSIFTALRIDLSALNIRALVFFRICCERLGGSFLALVVAADVGFSVATSCCSASFASTSLFMMTSKSMGQLLDQEFARSPLPTGITRHTERRLASLSASRAFGGISPSSMFYKLLAKTRLDVRGNGLIRRHDQQVSTSAGEDPTGDERAHTEFVRCCFHPIH